MTIDLVTSRQSSLRKRKSRTSSKLSIKRLYGRSTGGLGNEFPVVGENQEKAKTPRVTGELGGTLLRKDKPCVFGSHISAETKKR